MHVGIQVMFPNLVPGISDREIFKHEMSLIVRAEEMGFDSVWAPEHHFSGYTMTPNVPQMLSYLAARTKHLRLGTMVTVLPWNDPVRVAENFALLDHLSDGRSILGIGRGLGRIEFEGFRRKMSESRRQFTEYSEAILNALETGIMEYDGEMLKQPRVEIRPAPFKSYKGRTFASAISPSSFDIMAKLRVGLLMSPQKPWDVVKSDFDSYRVRYREINGEEAPKPILSILVGVSESASEAQAMRDKYLGGYSKSAARHYEFDNMKFAEIEGYEYYGAIAKSIAKFGLGKFEDMLADLHVWGTPEQVADKLLGYVEMLDTSGYIICLNFGGMPPEVSIANYDLFVRKVLPVLKARDVGGDIGIKYGELRAVA